MQCQLVNKRLACVALIISLGSACASIQTADTKEFVRARSQTEGVIHIIKREFKPRDLEYVKTEEAYARLKGDYDCILDAFSNAVGNGKDPNDEQNFGTCATDGLRHRDDFTALVHEVLTTPRRDPVTNQNMSIADKSPNVSAVASTITNSLPLFEKVTDLAIKYHEKYQKATEEQRAREVARLQLLRWRTWADIP